MPDRGLSKLQPVRNDGAKRLRAKPAPPPPDLLLPAEIAAADLPPDLRGRVMALLGEREELRRALDVAQSRIGQLEKLVDEDPLIPIANRRAFLRELTRMMAFAQRYGVPGSVAYFDVNNLKHINDIHGHAAGDAALQQVGRVLVESVRTSDVVARLGGDELAVLLVQTDQALGERKAAELARLIETRPVQWQGTTVSLSVAYGVHAFIGGENAPDVLDAADREMYRRKAKRGAPGA